MNNHVNHASITTLSHSVCAIHQDNYGHLPFCSSRPRGDYEKDAVYFRVLVHAPFLPAISCRGKRRGLLKTVQRRVDKRPVNQLLGDDTTRASTGFEI